METAEVHQKFGALLNKYLSEPSGRESSRRLTYFMLVVWCLGFFSGYIPFNGLDDKVVDIIKTLIYVSGGCVGLGRFAEAMDANKNKT